MEEGGEALGAAAAGTAVGVTRKVVSCLESRELLFHVGKSAFHSHPPIPVFLHLLNKCFILFFQRIHLICELVSLLAGPVGLPQQAFEYSERPADVFVGYIASEGPFAFDSKVDNVFVRPRHREAGEVGKVNVRLR